MGVLLNAAAGSMQGVLKPELARLGYEGEFHKLPGKSTTIGVATFWHSRAFRLLKVCCARWAACQRRREHVCGGSHWAGAL